MNSVGKLIAGMDTRHAGVRIEVELIGKDSSAMLNDIGIEQWTRAPVAPEYKHPNASVLP